MSNKTLRIWFNAHLPEANLAQLRDGVAAMGKENELVHSKAAVASNLVGGKPDDECRNADVAFGQPDPSDVIESTRLKWIHLTSAGYTRYERDDLRAALKTHSAVMTNSSSVYDEPCSEHLFAMIMSTARRLSFLVMDQEKRKWDSHPHRAQCFLLSGQSVVIVGFGAIAHRLVELLAPFKMNISAVRRHPTGREPVRTLKVEQIDELLGTADHVVNILPASNQTRGFFGAPRLARIKPGAFFYNIGRGDTVDQAALIAELQAKHLAGAYLDVTTPEPLPPDNPLWAAPNCWITPHTAGGHATEFDRQVQHFLENLGRFSKGETLLDQILK